MITESYVTYELAVKLKECGFDWETEYYYEFEEPTDADVVFKRTSLCRPFNHNVFEESYSAPTLAQAAKWLREIKGVKVYPMYDYFNNAWYFHCGLSLKYIRNSAAIYSSYESALSAGIDASFELLTDNLNNNDDKTI